MEYNVVEDLKKIKANISMMDLVFSTWATKSSTSIMPFDFGASFNFVPPH
jgi:hypothetical protein